MKEEEQGESSSSTCVKWRKCQWGAGAPLAVFGVIV